MLDARPDHRIFKTDLLYFSSYLCTFHIQVNKYMAPFTTFSPAGHTHFTYPITDKPTIIYRHCQLPSTTSNSTECMKIVCSMHRILCETIKEKAAPSAVSATQPASSRNRSFSAFLLLQWCFQNTIPDNSDKH